MSWVTKTIEEPISRLQVLDQRQHVLLHHHVERRGRLVGNDELGVAHGREPDGDALAHAARQLVRIGVEDVGDRASAVLEVPDHALPERGAAEAERAAGEVLEDAADPRAAGSARSSSPA